MLRAITALAVSFAVPAIAQETNCAPRQVVQEKLEGQFKESRRVSGLTAEGNAVMEIWGLEGGTWTLTVTMPNGMTCIVGAGGAFSSHDPYLPPEGDPA